MENVQKRINSTAALVERATLEISPDDDKETPEQKRERIASLEADPEAWFAYYFRKYATSKPAKFHIEASKRVLSNPEWYEVRMWSRELAKSTRTMMEVLYLTLVGNKNPNYQSQIANSTKKRYVLLISNSYDNACRLLLPYKFSLEKNQYLIRDYGIQKKYGYWKNGEFITKQGVRVHIIK